jgi:cytoskeletal protein CcmA (bactofilin family)
MKLSEVNGDLKIGKGATIVAENETITVNGKIRNKGGFKCKGNLVARSIESEKGSIKIYGDLTSKRNVEADIKLIVHGILITEEASAGMTVKVAKGVVAEKVSAGMRVTLNGDIKVDSISAGGRVELHGKSEVGKISAGRRVNLFGYHEVEKISSGAKTVVTNGKFEKISTGMAVISKGDVEIGKVSAGFAVKLKGKASIGNGSAGFKVKATGPITFGNLSAGFKVICKKDSSGETASAGFRVMSFENLEIKDSISAGFSCSAKKKLSARKISAGRKIKAKYIEADVITVAKRGRLIGLVKANRVVLRERARASNLYVQELIMEERSKARNVFAEFISIEDKAVLKGKVEYTREIEAESKARIRAKPKKVEKLPTLEF